MKERVVSATVCFRMIIRRTFRFNDGVGMINGKFWYGVRPMTVSGWTLYGFSEVEKCSLKFLLPLKIEVARLTQLIENTIDSFPYSPGWCRSNRCAVDCSSTPQRLQPNSHCSFHCENCSHCQPINFSREHDTFLVLFASSLVIFVTLSWYWWVYMAPTHRWVDIAWNIPCIHSLRWYFHRSEDSASCNI